MSENGHLLLRHHLLPGGSEWILKGDGLLFVAAKNAGGSCTTRRTSHLLEDGDVVIVSGTTGAMLAAPKNRPLTFAWFAIRLDQFYPLLACGEIFLLSELADFFNEPRHYSRASSITSDYRRILKEGDSESTLTHRGRLLHIAASLLSQEIERIRATQTGGVSHSDHFSRILDGLSTEEFLRMGIPALATKFNCGRRHLNRLFHKHLGSPVAALQMELRLLKAAFLLRHPTAKIIHIAAECGFHHLGLFNKYFRRRYGDSPGKWRKTMLQVDEHSNEDANLCHPAISSPAPAVQINGKASEIIKRRNRTVPLEEAKEIQLPVKLSAKANHWIQLQAARMHAAPADSRTARLA